MILALMSTAHAVAITNDSNSVNLVAPANDPGWNNVAQMSGATAVYLGNDWMITANHVSDGPVTFSNGEVINVVPNSDIGFSNPPSTGLGGSPDLRMFQLATNPGLPSLQISSTTPTAGTTVTMIGAGVNHAPNLIGWDISPTTSTTPNVWTQVALPYAQVTGFALSSGSQMRWGMNQVQAGGDVAVSPNGSTTVISAAFTTLFSSHSFPYAAQAVSGDSGGGVFQQVNGPWQLAGIMDAQQPLTGQPGGTVVYGEQTYAIDLSVYASQISAVLDPKDPWQNLVNPLDVSRSGQPVDALDALLIINALEKAGGSYTLTGTPGPTDPLLDVNGDGMVSPLDLLDIINALNPPATTTASVANVAIVPEPSTAVLGLSGILLVLMMRRIARARCFGITG